MSKNNLWTCVYDTNNTVKYAEEITEELNPTYFLQIRVKIQISGSFMGVEKKCILYPWYCSTFFIYLIAYWIAARFVKGVVHF